MNLREMPDDERDQLLEELGEWLLDQCLLFGMPSKDAEDATDFALEAMIEKWKKIEALNGKNSLKQYLEKTAIREFLRPIAKQRRTDSLQESIGSKATEEATRTLEEKEGDMSQPSFYDLTLVRAEDVELV